MINYRIYVIENGITLAIIKCLKCTIREYHYNIVLTPLI